MALADYQALKDAIERGKQYFFTKNSQTCTSTKLTSLWLTTPDAGAIPSTPAVCNADTVGALFSEPRLTSLSKSYHLAQAEAGCFTTSNSSLWLIDRLCHQGGLSGTATATQTTNLPTAALTRYTDGVGVMAAIEIYAAIGTLAQTATVSYTNQAGVAGRTSKPVVIGAASDNALGRFIPIPLQDDDIGVRSVESVTPSSSTATAGNYGITLFKPLMLLPNLAVGIHAIQQRCMNPFIGGFGGSPVIDDAACLQLLAVANTSSVGIVHGAFHLAEA
jgi:hypothetical protein